MCAIHGCWTSRVDTPSVVDCAGGHRLHARFFCRTLRKCGTCNVQRKSLQHTLRRRGVGVVLWFDLHRRRFRHTLQGTPGGTSRRRRHLFPAPECVCPHCVGPSAIDELTTNACSANAGSEAVIGTMDTAFERGLPVVQPTFVQDLLSE